MPHYTDHARENMEFRCVSEEDVELTLAHPDADFPSRNPDKDRHIYLKEIGGRSIHVVVEAYDHETVVSVLIPNPKRKRRRAR